MENQVYCRAVISKEKPVIYKVLKIIMIICFVACIVAVLPVRREEHKDWNIRGEEYKWWNYYNVFDMMVFTKWSDGDLTNYVVELLALPFLFLLLNVIILGICVLIRKAAQQCSLELNQDGLFGEKKTFFSIKSINQPFEKIDNVYIKNGIFDKMFGGETVVISTTSSRIKLLCIENADEFVNKTLEELKAYKTSVAASKSSTSTVSGGDTMDSILKLKNLLDQGLISQDEFDEKRKELISKI